MFILTEAVLILLWAMMSNITFYWITLHRETTRSIKMLLRFLDFFNTLFGSVNHFGLAVQQICMYRSSQECIIGSEVHVRQKCNAQLHRFCSIRRPITHHKFITDRSDMSNWSNAEISEQLNWEQRFWLPRLLRSMRTLN